MRSLIAACLPLALSFTSLTACTTEQYDELAGETAADAAGDGKADTSADGVYTYFAIKTDLRECVAPACGGVFVSRLNRSTTVCHDGASAPECYAAEVDWSESGLSEASQREVLAKMTDGATADGVTTIVRGRLAPLATSTATAKKGAPTFGRFIVTEAWTAQSASVSDGVFVKVKDRGVRCIASPCESLGETALNTSRDAGIAGIDFEPSGLTEAQLSAVSNDMFGGAGGVIVAGSRYTISEGPRTARGRTATATYRRVVDRAAEGCFVGGCSGQVCSDQEGVITTCEWREEYACYQQATCGRQEDGSCGWNQTAELQACLGN